MSNAISVDSYYQQKITIVVPEIRARFTMMITSMEEHPLLCIGYLRFTYCLCCML